jgi:hypothetical protein
MLRFKLKYEPTAIDFLPVFEFSFCARSTAFSSGKYVLISGRWQQAILLIGETQRQHTDSVKLFTLLPQARMNDVYFN